ncbi:MAG: homoserine kinase [Acidimicrobiales bacterium]
MRARAPASSANLGPGYDVLAVALSLYVEVEVTPAPALSIESRGEGAEMPLDGGHLAARVVSEVLGHDRAHISVSSDVPVGRGLGSSAALAVAAAAAAGAPDPLALGARFDGHCENAAAAFHGGLVAATLVDGRPLARSLWLDDALRLVLVVPAQQLPTKAARSLLPSAVALDDAVFNLGRLGLLIAGLADRRALVAQAGDDRLHQAPRGGQFPESGVLLEALRRGGATVACWSGAGPSLLGICDGDEAASSARRAAADAMADVGVKGGAFVVDADRRGLVVSQ